MDYRITFKRQWHYRHPKKGRCVIDVGTYNVPEDLPLSCAQIAVDQGMATMFKIQSPTVLRESDLELVSQVVFNEEAPPEQPAQKPRRKGRAPKNKSLGRAPEDKSTLV